VWKLLAMLKKVLDIRYVQVVVYFIFAMNMCGKLMKIAILQYFYKSRRAGATRRSSLEKSRGLQVVDAIKLYG